MSDVVLLSDEEDALYDLSEEEFEIALKEAMSEGDEADVADEPEEKEKNQDENQDNDNEDDIKKDEDEKELEQSNKDSDESGEEKDAKEPDDKSGVNKEDDQNKADKSEIKEPDVKSLDNSKADEAKPTKTKYRASGQEFEFTDEEIKERFGQVFAQSIDYTKKMQEIKPWRASVSAMQENGLTHSDIELLIDAKKGDMGAINKLIGDAGIDPVELDPENSEQEYKRNQYGQSNLELEISDIVKEISVDPEYAITQNVLSNQWDQSSRNAFLDNPSLIKKLHTDVKSGDFDVLNAEAMKMKVYDGGRLSDIEYYAQAAKVKSQKSVSQNISNLTAKNNSDADAEKDRLEAEAKRISEEANRIAEIKIQEEKRKQAAIDDENRKAATISQKSSGKKTVVDYLDDNDEAFDEWYKKIQASQ